MTINLIWAQTAKDGVIGKQGFIPWYIPEDLAFFKIMTEYQSVVMGRKTWESLPRKPLINRRNIVLSRTVKDIHGVTVHDCVEKVLDAGYGELWVIGGSEIYKEFMPYADTLVITLIHADFNGDCYAPDISLDDWEVTNAGARTKSVSGIEYEVNYYERKKN
jgi:dihydrofolate reductase